MRVLIAPDCFGGSLTAREAADAIAAGWRRSAPGDQLDLAPLSDGGPGFLDALDRVGGRTTSVATTDPLGRAIEAAVLQIGDTAYIESAQACGLHLLARHERDPERTSTAGVAALVSAAVRGGAVRIVVGLGGSGTNDGGRGFLEALDPDVAERCAALDLVAATDVDNPLLGLTGASAIFGPQKGADASAVQRLDFALETYARSLDLVGVDAMQLAAQPGAGAAGGLGFALFTLGARRVAGFEVVRDALGLGDRVESADLVLTGEGRYDSESLRGKVPGGVAALAAEFAVPCVVLAGQVAVGRREAAAHGITEMHALVENSVGADRPDLAAAIAAAMAGAADRLADLAARIATQWSPSRRP
jgi:glycerate kinase